MRRVGLLRRPEVFKLPKNLRFFEHEPRFESLKMRRVGFEPTNGLTDKITPFGIILSYAIT